MTQSPPPKPGLAQTDEGAGAGGGSRGRALVAMGLALLVALPALVVRVGGLHPPPPLAALIFGIAVVGAAFVLSWAAEAAQVDIAAGLALALLALIAVLPEYAVDFVFAYKGGTDFSQFGRECRPPGSTVESACSLSLANMTGSNRILIGIGWSLVVLVAAYALHRRHQNGAGSVELERTKTVDLAFLAAATLYSLTLPLRDSLSLVDAVVLVGIFVAYAWRLSKAPPQEPDLVGPSLWIGGLAKKPRRTLVIVLFVAAAGVILASAEPFAEALVETGVELGISEFFLVQWVAPFASEAPELLVAVLFAWRLKTSDALGTLLSSKVNQWTLLVGTLPIVFAVAAGSTAGLPIDARQREELFLTAAQSAFAVALLVGLSIGVRGALALFGLFVAQFLIEALAPESVTEVGRIGLAVLYLVLAAGVLVARRKHLKQLFVDGFRTPYKELVEH